MKKSLVLTFNASFLNGLGIFFKDCMDDRLPPDDRRVSAPISILGAKDTFRLVPKSLSGLIFTLTVCLMYHFHVALMRHDLT